MKDLQGKTAFVTGGAGGIGFAMARAFVNEGMNVVIADVDAQALATLAFAQLFIVVLNEGGAVTGGPGGLANYRLPDILGVRVTGPWYTVVIVFLLLGTLATLWRLDRSWFGRACRAVRDDPQAAQAIYAAARALARALNSGD